MDQLSCRTPASMCMAWTGESFISLSTTLAARSPFTFPFHELLLTSSNLARDNFRLSTRTHSEFFEDVLHSHDPARALWTHNNHHSLVRCHYEPHPCNFDSESTLANPPKLPCYSSQHSLLDLQCADNHHLRGVSDLRALRLQPWPRDFPAR